MKHLILLTLALVLAGCSQGDYMADLRAYVAEVDSKPKGKIEPPPVFLPYEFFTYSAVSLRAPFEIPLEVEVASGERPRSNVVPDDTRLKEILEDYRFESLSMVGTIAKADNELWALIKDGDNDVHRIKVGNYMGKNNGKVFNITLTQIDVMEIVPDGQGGWLERPRSMMLAGVDK
jgi:type IV pilus assembly protein PilP